MGSVMSYPALLTRCQNVEMYVSMLLPFILSCSRVAAAFCTLTVSVKTAVNAVSKSIHNTELLQPMGSFVQVTFLHSALT